MRRAPRASETLDVVVDPDFDGGLVVPPAVAERLGLHLSEIPRPAEVQVALGRPFDARRALALAGVPSLSASAPVEVLFEKPLGEGTPAAR